MDAALADLRSEDGLKISDVARKHRISRSALSKRIHAKTPSKARGYESQRMLSDKQEDELVNYIYHLCERCLPPTPKIVANIAQELCGRRLSKN
jgi:transposase-like protein